MADRGRKPLPSNIHLLKGTYRKDRHGPKDEKSDIKGKVKFPIMPRWLPQTAKTEWQRLRKIMEPINVITGADRTILIQCCLLYSQMVAEKEDFQAAKHAQLRVCASELGLTPGTRNKYQLDDNSNEFDEF